MSNSKDKIIITFGLLTFTIGIILLASNYLEGKTDYAYSYMNNLLLIEDNANKAENEEIQEEVDEELETSSLIKEEDVYVDPYLSYYVGSLEIPKINLKKGFTAMNSPYNTVNRNVEIVKSSNYPDVKNGNFILAAHSGNSYLGYFQNLYKLEKGDMAYVNYNNHRYSYKITNIYLQEKTGKIAIYRDYNKTTMTLVTCTRNSKTQQTVYILELINIE